MTVTRPPSARVIPAKNSELEQLHAQYTEAKAALDAAEARLKAITDGIKAELTKAAPEQGRVDLVSEYGPPMYLTWVVSRRIDSTRLKTERPDVFQAYQKESGAWQLKQAKGGAE